MDGSVDPAKTISCTDSHKSSLQMPEMLGVECKFFVTTKAKPEGFHVQNLDQLRVARRGAKYLPNYLAWQMMQTWKAEPMSQIELIGSALGHQLINLK